MEDRKMTTNERECTVATVHHREFIEEVPMLFASLPPE